MSGRKQVLKEMMEDGYELPTKHQKIVRIVSSRGSNLHEVRPPAGDIFLASMPKKFRRTVWVTRGDFVLVEPIEEGYKVKGEISKILTVKHVKEYTKAGIWPTQFAKKRESESDEQMSISSDSSDSEEFVVKNLNRPTVYFVEDSSDSDASSD